MSVSPQAAQQVLERADLLYSAEQVSQALDRLAEEISQAVTQASPEQPVIVISVMNGGLVLAGHLLTRFNFPLHVDFIHATRYRNQTSGGELEWKVEPHQSLSGRTLVILDDILDEGYTLQAIVDYCKRQEAENVISAVLAEKKHDRRTPGVHCDFIGLQVEDRYVFGFGMDYKGYHRNLNGIYAVGDD
jgi:hypoxanthine phosphoribosyltransferase